MRTVNDRHSGWISEQVSQRNFKPWPNHIYWRKRSTYSSKWDRNTNGNSAQRTSHIHEIRLFLYIFMHSVRLVGAHDWCVPLHQILCRIHMHMFMLFNAALPIWVQRYVRVHRNHLFLSFFLLLFVRSCTQIKRRIAWICLLLPLVNRLLNCVWTLNIEHWRLTGPNVH